MSLAHALLTALVERPCCGAELTDRFNRSIGYFWPATHQQIYRELATMKASGWIEPLPIETGRGRKRAYKVSPAGLSELKRWVGELQAPRPVRDELMVRLRAAATLGPTDLTTGVETLLAAHRATLAHYLALEEKDFSDPDTTRKQRLRHLILRAGIESEAHWIDFCERALALLDK